MMIFIYRFFMITTFDYGKGKSVSEALILESVTVVIT